MKGYQISFIAEQDRRIEGKPATEWLIRLAKHLGIAGTTTFAGVESFGADGRRHSARFIELTDQPIEVMMQHFKGLWVPVLVAIVLVTLGRAIAIYPLCAAFTRSHLKVSVRHQHILFWGGLRGALALALALSLPEHLPQHDVIVAITFAVVAFSVFAQGLTITPLLRHLGQIK